MQSKGHNDPIRVEVTLGREDIMVIKARNSLQALKRLVKSQGFSFGGKSSSSSSMSGGDIGVDPITVLFGQLKVKFFYMDLFKAMEDDPSVKFKFKQLLTEFGDHDFLDPLL